jgi:hypothetical protein
MMGHLHQSIRIAGEVVVEDQALALLVRGRKGTCGTRQGKHHRQCGEQSQHGAAIVVHARFLCGAVRPGEVKVGPAVFAA